MEFNHALNGNTITSPTKRTRNSWQHSCPSEPPSNLPVHTRRPSTSTPKNTGNVSFIEAVPTQETHHEPYSTSQQKEKKLQQVQSYMTTVAGRPDEYAQPLGDLTDARHLEENKALEVMAKLVSWSWCEGKKNKETRPALSSLAFVPRFFRRYCLKR